MSDEAMDQDTKLKAEVQNGEHPAGKETLLMHKVVSLKDQVDKIVDAAKAVQDVSKICAAVRKLRELADAFISAATSTDKQGKDASELWQYVANVQGLRQQHVKDMKNILQNALGLGTVKFAPPTRNSPFVEIFFTTEEVMNKGLKIVRNKPLGLTLCVVKTRKLDKSCLPPKSVFSSVAAEFDPMIMLKESLLRSRELTEEEYNRTLKWKEKFIQHVLSKTCNQLDPYVTTIAKDHTEGYFFKLEGIRSVTLSTESETYHTSSGVNPDTGKVEMGYWGLGSDVPSRIPRSACIRNVLKVLTDFMETSSKPFYDLRVRKGYWYSITIRANHEGQCMVVLVVHVKASTDREKECESLKPLLVELFETGDGKDCGVKSIHMKTLAEVVESGRKGDASKGGKSGGNSEAWFFVYGEEHLDEELVGLKVRLYKNTFFSGDGDCTEQLCKTIVKELQLHEESGVLEIGAGTGLICMYLAKRCKVVCGLHRQQTFLPRVEKNVELNELKNIVFVHCTPSTTLTYLKPHFKECENVCAFILEASIKSRNQSEVAAMRKALWIKKVAYLIISYKNRNITTTNLMQLCSKLVDDSEPFVIVKVIPFDTASASFRPDVLILLERASALDDRTEERVPKMKPTLSVLDDHTVKRVPKTKPKSSTTPPLKRARLSDGPHPRSLLVRKRLRPPPMREPGVSEGRGYMGRGFSQNNNLRPRRGSSFRTQGDGTIRPLLSFVTSEPITTMRAVEEAEAWLAKRMRIQEEEQLHQLPKAVMQSKQRHPTPVANIEEAVLSAIKKTGLLQRVAALTDMPQKSRMEMEGSSRDESWSRFNERHSPDLQSGSYRQRGSDSQTSRDRYDSRNSQNYQDRGLYGNGSQDLPPEPRGRGSSRYHGQGLFSFLTKRSSGGARSSYKPKGSYYN